MPKSRSLRSRLTVAFGLLVLLLLSVLQLTRLFGVPGTGFGGVLAERRAQTFRHLDLVADLKKDRLRRWLQERHTDLRVTASREVVVRAAMRLQTSQAGGLPTSQRARELAADPSYHKVIVALQALVNAYVHFRKFSLLDPKTALVLASSRPQEVGKRDPGGLTRGASQRIGRVHPAQSGVFVLPLITPVHAQGKVMALLVGEVAIDEIVQPILHTGQALGETGEALLVDDRQRILTSLRHPLQGGRRPSVLAHRIDAEPARRAAQGRQGQIAAADYRGVQVLASYRSIDVDRDQRWGLVVKQDVAELEAPLRREVTVTLVVSALGLTAMLFLIFVVARNLTAPLLTVARTADALAQGDLSARSGVQRRDEIGRVAHALDGLANRTETMLQALDQRSAELEIAVASAEQRGRVQTAGLVLSTALTAASNLETLAHDALHALLRQSAFLAGALYLRAADNAHLERYAAAGIDGEKLPGRIEEGEGLEGRALQRRELQLLEDVPEDTRFVLRLLSGDALPRVLLALPLIHEGSVIGVLSLASLKPLGDEQRDILALAETPLVLSLANALGHQKTAELAHAVQTANEELAVTNEELIVTNEELIAQARELADRTAQVEEQRREVEQANRLKSEFLANMSHELRTPLSSVLALTQLLGDRIGDAGRDPDRAKEREYITVIDRNARHLLELINDVLDLSRIEAGHIDLSLATFDAQDVAQQAIDTLRQLAEGKGLKLSLRCEGATTLQSDRDRLLQILLNLLGNAVKFTSTGEIELLLRREAESLSLLVKDTGIGISADFVPHLFEPFRQADGSTTRRHEGTGLGLTIVAQLVEALGGTVEVDSAVGRGSTFTVRLPVAGPQQPLPPPPGTPTRARPQPGAEVSLLVVEDNAIASLQLCTILRQEGFRVSSAAHGVEALQQIAAEKPALIVLDLMMPEMDGFELLRQLRAVEATRDVPVLVVTAKALTRADRESLATNGVYELIQKGRINRQDLIARVHRLLADRGLSSLDPSEGKR